MRVLMVGATGRHRLAQPYSLSAKFCSVDYRDVAEVAARAMTGGDASELSHGTFELSAPGMEDSHQTAAAGSAAARADHRWRVGSLGLPWIGAASAVTFSRNSGAR